MTAARRAMERAMDENRQSGNPMTDTRAQTFEEWRAANGWAPLDWSIVAVQQAAWNAAWSARDEEIAAKDARIREWALALQSLTPGGSEYVDDPTRCVAFVREARELQHRVIGKLKRERDEARSSLAAKDAEIERLTKLASRLKDYSLHHEPCEHRPYGPCICGLAALLSTEGEKK
jgi:hypothetical protein